MERSGLIVTTGACAIALALPCASPAKTDEVLPSAKRPHSRAAVYVHRDVVVRRMLFTGRRVAGRIHGTIGFAVENRSRTDRAVVLRAGRCTRGRLGYPTCPSAHRIRILVRAGGRRSVFRRVVLRQPPPRQDTIELSVTASDRARPPYGSSRHLGNLLLRGRAWREIVPTWFRYDAARRPAGPEIVRARLDVPALSRSAIRPTLAWQARGIGDLTTTLLACPRHDPCIGPLATRTWTGPATAGLQERPVVRAAGAKGVLMDVAHGDDSLLQIVLPWPI